MTNGSEWDPLFDDVKTAPGVVNAAKKRELQNILKSYTGYFDLFAEMLQNALDAVEKRAKSSKAVYKPEVIIKIDLKKGEHQVTVVDNGCGMDLTEFKTFLRPSYSFKDGEATRGSKGVGATYLAFAFNSLTIATKQKGNLVASVLSD